MGDLIDDGETRAMKIAMLVSEKKMLWRRFIAEHIFGGVLRHK